MKIRLPKGALDPEGILMLGLVAAVLLMDAFAACSGEPAGDAVGGTDTALTGIAAMSLESYPKAVHTLSSDEFDPAWDLTGALDDFRLAFVVTYGCTPVVVRPASSDPGVLSTSPATLT